MAISTYKTFLMRKASSEQNYTKLLDIKSFPDLGGEPNMIETTTLSDPMQTFILGIKSSGGLTFNANYDKAEYTSLKALEGKEEEYAVWFGGEEQADGTVKPTGDNGMFSFGGQLSVRITGGEVNQAVGMSVTIAPNTPIVFE